MGTTRWFKDQDNDGTWGNQDSSQENTWSPGNNDPKHGNDCTGGIEDAGQGNDDSWGNPSGGSSKEHDTNPPHPPSDTKPSPSNHAPELPPPKGLEHLVTRFNLLALTALKDVMDRDYTRQATSGVDLYCGVNALEI